MNKHQKLYKAQELLEEVWGEVVDLSKDQEDKLADLINNLRNFREDITKEGGKRWRLRHRI